MDYSFIGFVSLLWSLTAMNSILYRKDSPQILLLCYKKKKKSYKKNGMNK